MTPLHVTLEARIRAAELADVPPGATPIETGFECPVCSMVGRGVLAPDVDGWHRAAAGPNLGRARGTILSCSRLLWYNVPDSAELADLVRESLLRRRLGPPE